jgi:hypothetical protein
MKRQKIMVVIIKNGRISMKAVKSTVKGEVRRTRPSIREVGEVRADDAADCQL